MADDEGEFAIHIAVLKGESTLEAMGDWMEYVVSDDCLLLAGGLYETKKNKASMLATSRQVINEEVLDINRNSDRTGRLLRSFQVTHGESNKQVLASLVVYSDPSIAKTKGPTRANKANLSYAAFFERPEFNTFIAPGEPWNSELKYRPFMDPLVNAIQIQGTRAFAEAYIQAIKQRMPKRLSNPLN